MDRDESDNFAQKHDDELARAEVRPTVEEEIRKQVVDAAPQCPLLFGFSLRWVLSVVHICV